jgi:hypothetical protein
VTTVGVGEIALEVTKSFFEVHLSDILIGSYENTIDHLGNRGDYDKKNQTPKIA